MIDKNELVPTSKEDIEFIQKLKLQTIENVKEIVPELLEWLQDGNWPQAHLIADYIRPHMNYCENEIIDILNTDDSMWKSWVMKGIILKSSIAPTRNIIDILKRIYETPTLDEKESEVDIVAYDIMTKFRDSADL